MGHFKQGKVTDFTKMRAGKVTRRDADGKATRWIEKCPKCGRNGERKEFHTQKHDFTEYYHKERYMEVAGLPFNEVLDHCMITKPKPEVIG